jgi:hypothetical protein
VFSSHFPVHIFLVGFDMLTAVVRNVAIFWDIAPCSPYVNRRFGRTYHVQLGDRKMNRTRNQHVALNIICDCCALINLKNRLIQVFIVNIRIVVY